MRRSSCAERSRQRLRDRRDVVRIELHVRIALRMNVAERPIELARLLQQRQHRGRLEVAGAPGWMRLLPDSWISTGSQPISSSAPVATTRSARARARDQARLGVDAMHVLQRAGRDVDVDLVAAELLWPARPSRTWLREP